MTEILDRHYEKLGLAPWVKPEVQRKDIDDNQHNRDKHPGENLCGNTGNPPQHIKQDRHHHYPSHQQVS